MLIFLCSAMDNAKVLKCLWNRKETMCTLKILQIEDDYYWEFAQTSILNNFFFVLKLLSEKRNLRTEDRASMKYYTKLN